jgi:hypothetical protein
MKKELLIASALTASFGLASVAEAGANVSYSGSVTAGVTADDVGGDDTGQTAVQTSELSFSIDQTTDSGIKWSTSLEIIDEGGSDSDEGGLTLTFTDGSTLDIIEAGSAFGGAIASIPGAGGEQGITNTSTNNAPGDLDWADASDAVGFDWGSAGDFAGIEGLTVGVSAAFGNDTQTTNSSGAETTYSVGLTYAADAGDTAITVGAGMIQATSDNNTALNEKASSSAISISAVTGNLTLGAGYSNGSGTASKTPDVEIDSVNYVEAGASYVTGDLTMTVSMVSGEAADSTALGTAGASTDETKNVSGSVAYAVADGISATIGYTDVDNTDEAANVVGNSGTSWYVGATVSF